MTAFTIGGDWTWSGTATFTGFLQAEQVIALATVLPSSPGTPQGVLFGMQAWSGSGAGTPSAGYGFLYVDTSDNLHFYNSVADYQLTAGGAGVFYKLGGQVFGAAQYLGSTDSNSLEIGTASTNVVVIGASQNLTITSIGGASYTDSATITLDAPTLLIAPTLCTTLTAGNSGCSVDIEGNIISIGLNTPSTIVLICNDTSTLTLTAASMSIASFGSQSIIENVGTLDIEGVTMNIGVNSAITTSLALGTTGIPLTINSDTWNATNVGTQTGTIAVPSHTPPAGYNYLCINTTTGQIQQFSA